MDAKTPLLPHHEDTTDTDAMRPPRSSRRFRRFHAAGLIALVGLFWLGLSWQCQEPTHSHPDVSKVPLEVHIMSKCPDARDCLQKLVVPTMQDVSEKVDFRLSFIGRTTEEDDGVQCMHGQTECLGNILELCAADLYPDPKIYLGFTMCLSRNYQDIPKKDLIEDCSLEHGIDFTKLNHCVSEDDGAHAMGMLRSSVEHSAQVNVTKSCTVRLDNKVRCVLDGGRYYDCEGGSKPKDLIRDINSLYAASKGWSE